MSKSACGPQTELMSNNAVRVTRCSCGTVHVTLVASGVTVRMQADTFRNVVAGLHGAVDKLESPAEITSTGSTSIN
jgi:hypothetical protein